MLDGLRPVTELARTKPHGTRLKYLGGCRCTPCRAANSGYYVERERQIAAGNWNGLISAAPARQHIEMLSDIGIGYKTVADIARMATSSVFKIRTGQRKNIRALNSKAILAIDRDARPDSALVCAKGTWRKINWLLTEGFTKASLAKRLGHKSPALQIRKDRITARTKLKVEQLYNQLRIGE